MAERKQLSKKLRFEVFKRDGFTCQYCGRTSPDVVLEVDHIKPVASGGKNDMLNLVTACFDCNRGKRDRELSDNSVVSMQQRQLVEMHERRQQLQMMLEWRAELSQIAETQIDAINSMFSLRYNSYLTASGRAYIKTLIRRFGFIEVYESAEIAFEQYEPIMLALDKIGGICYNRMHGITGKNHAK